MTRKQHRESRDLQSQEKVKFTVHEYADDFQLIRHVDHKIHLDMPELLKEIRRLPEVPTRYTTSEFPIVLSAGERRPFTANDILRDPSWRKRDSEGALRVSVEDARQLGLIDGGRARITIAAGSAEASVEISEAMQPGHVSLPNGYGLDFTDGDGTVTVPGVAPNMLTSTQWRDVYAGTPWHKHVPARLEAVLATMQWGPTRPANVCNTSSHDGANRISGVS